jgi:nucleotide-binding universal stress UspA family protein
MYDHVLVGTDGSTTATRAVEAAARLAQVHNAKLTIAYAFDPRQREPQVSPAVEAELGWLLSSSGARAEAVVTAAIDHAQAVACGGLTVDGRAEPGRPAPVLATIADELPAAAVVVGNADVRRFGLRGSVGHAVSRRVRSDVMIVNTVGLVPSRPGRGRAA